MLDMSLEKICIQRTEFRTKIVMLLNSLSTFRYYTATPESSLEAAYANEHEYKTPLSKQYTSKIV